MFTSWISNLISQKQKKDTQAIYDYRFNSSNYPPENYGIKVRARDELTTFFKDDIHFLRVNLGVDDEDFKIYVMPVINNVIEFLNYLPASQYHHHSAPGGLVHHSLDVAKRAMNKAKMSFFPSSSGKIHLGQRCTVKREVACILAALMHDVGKVVTDMKVSNGKEGDDKQRWSPLSGVTLFDWVNENGIDEIFVDWKKHRHNEHHQVSSIISIKLLPEKTWRWLTDCEEGDDICLELWNGISGLGRENPIKTIVSQADLESVRFDLSHQYKHWSIDPVRRPIHQLISIQIRCLLSDGRWRINSKDAVLWFIDDQLYIAWTKAVVELSEHLVNLEYSIPTRPETLANALIEEGFCEGNGEDVYFDIFPEILGNSKKPVRLQCLKVSNASSLIPNLEKVYPIKQHRLKVKPATPELESKQSVNTNDRVETAVVQTMDESDIDSSFKLKETAIEKHRTANSLGEEVTIVSVLADEGFEVSSDGKVIMSQGDIDLAVQLIQSAGISGINEVNAYSKLKACQYVVITGERYNPKQ